MRRFLQISPSEISDSEIEDLICKLLKVEERAGVGNVPSRCPFIYCSSLSPFKEVCIKKYCHRLYGGVIP
jgi:hypothetical protein